LVAAQIDERLRALAGTWDSVRDLEARRRDIQRRVAGLTTAENDAASRLADWRDRWQSAVQTISLPATATTDEAQAALDVWKQVPAAVHERDNRDRRVAGMRRNIDQFERDTKNIVDAIAPDLAGLTPDVAVKTLNDRVTAAKAAASRRDATSGRVATTIRARQTADAALDQVRTAVADLMSSLPPNCDRQIWSRP
jgi:chromosome segregation protein